MNIVSLNGHTIDLDEVVTRQFEATSVSLTFRNGDKILLPWRDEVEKRFILQMVEQSK
jgi:hypothetical protein